MWPMQWNRMGNSNSIHGIPDRAYPDVAESTLDP